MSKTMPEMCGSSLNQSSYRWVILALAFSAFIMAFVSRFAWPPLMPVIMPDLGISGRSQGLAYMSAFYLGYIITQIPGGVLADRFGPRVVLTVAMTLQGLSALGMAFIPDYQLGFILRVICGLGGGCVYSACLKAITAWFSPVQRSIAIAVFMSAPTVGVALPNLMMPALEASFGWQTAFLIIGLAVIAVALLLGLFMKEIKNNTPNSQRKSFMVGLKYVFSNRNIFLISLAGFCGLWAQIGFGSLGNDYLVKTFGINLKSAGGIMVVYGCVGLLATLTAGWLASRLGGLKKYMLLGAHLLMGAFLLYFGHFSSITAALVGVSVIGITVAMANTLYVIMVAENAPPDWVATAGGVSNSICQFGALFSPLALGFAHDLSGSYGLTWPILGGVIILSSVFVILIKTKPSCATFKSTSPGLEFNQTNASTKTKA